jgi:hypothetical protein
MWRISETPIRLAEMLSLLSVKKLMAPMVKTFLLIDDIHAFGNPVPHTKELAFDHGSSGSESHSVSDLDNSYGPSSAGKTFFIKEASPYVRVDGAGSSHAEGTKAVKYADPHDEIGRAVPVVIGPLVVMMDLFFQARDGFSKWWLKH